jgi:hypothetical protein
MKSFRNLEKKAQPTLFSSIPYTSDCLVFTMINNLLIEEDSGLKLTKSYSVRVGSVHDDVICN